jgi:hypothetical protein
MPLLRLFYVQKGCSRCSVTQAVPHNPLALVKPPYFGPRLRLFEEIHTYGVYTGEVHGILHITLISQSSCTVTTGTDFRPANAAFSGSESQGLTTTLQLDLRSMHRLGCRFHMANYHKSTVQNRYDIRMLTSSTTNITREKIQQMSFHSSLVLNDKYLGTMVGRLPLGYTRSSLRRRADFLLLPQPTGQSAMSHLMLKKA